MADVSIDSTISLGTARGMRSVVFTTADIGYWFFNDGTTDRFSYRKTTDGGATWAAAVVLATSTTLAYDVWFDQWTPGDSGTLIHMWWFTSGEDDVVWRTLDTNGDTLGTQRNVFVGSTFVAGRGVFVSGTKTRSGYLYCAYDGDAGAERGFHRSTDSGTTWSANLSTTFVEATIDQCLLFPASNTGDNNDCWALYHDASADALTLKMWDSSAGSEVESATIQTLIENTTDQTGQYGFSGSVRHSDGHLIVATISERDTGTSDHQVFDINGTGSITEKTAITTNIDDHYYPAVFIDQSTDDIFVAFNGLRTGGETLGTTSKVYYTTSSDGGANWSAGSTAYMEGAAALVVQVWAPLMGPRFYVGWRVGSTLVGNKVNSVTFSGAGPSDITASDSATVSEAQATVGQAVASQAVTLSEAVTGTLAGVGIDVFTLSEAAIAQLVGQDLVAVETITLSESAVAALFAVGTESLTMSEAVASVPVVLVATDQLTFTDAVTALPVILTAADTGTVTDQASVQSGNAVSASDVLSFTESAVIATLLAAATESATLGEAVSPVGIVAVDDLFAFSESISTGGSQFTGMVAGTVTLAPWLTLHSGAGQQDITMDDIEITMDSELVTMDGSYLGDLSATPVDVSVAVGGQVEV